MIAAGIAARAVAKKLASRAAGGITGSGAKSVNKVYKNMGATKSEVKASARALKAAQGKSLAPRGYKPDTAGRARAKEFAEPLIKSRGRKEAMRDGAKAVNIERTRLEFPKAPKLKKGR